MNRRRSADYEMYLYAKAFSRSCRWVRVYTPPTRAEGVPSQVSYVRYLFTDLLYITLFGVAVFVGQCLIWVALAGLISEYWLGVSVILFAVVTVCVVERPYFTEQ
jgi:hypothetical protein